MEFKADKEIKQGISQEIIHNSLKLYILHIIKHGSLLCAIVGCLGYLAYGIIDSVPTNEILYNSITILISFLLIYAIFHWVLKSYLSQNLLERLDEKIDLSDNVIRYTFRLANSYDKYSRIAYNLVLKDLKSFTYNPDEYKLVFKGKMSIGKTNDMATVRSLNWSSPKETELVVYDYFEPSLYETLYYRGVLTDDMMEVAQDE